MATYIQNVVVVIYEFLLLMLFVDVIWRDTIIMKYLNQMSKQVSRAVGSWNPVWGWLVDLSLNYWHYLWSEPVDDDDFVLVEKSSLLPPTPQTQTPLISIPQMKSTGARLPTSLLKCPGCQKNFHLFATFVLHIEIGACRSAAKSCQINDEINALAVQLFRNISTFWMPKRFEVSCVYAGGNSYIFLCGGGAAWMRISSVNQSNHSSTNCSCIANLRHIDFIMKWHSRLISGWAPVANSLPWSYW